MEIKGLIEVLINVDDGNHSDCSAVCPYLKRYPLGIREGDVDCKLFKCRLTSVKKEVYQRCDACKEKFVA